MHHRWRTQPLWGTQIFSGWRAGLDELSVLDREWLRAIEVDDYQEEKHHGKESERKPSRREPHNYGWAMSPGRLFE